MARIGRKDFNVQTEKELYFNRKATRKEAFLSLYEQVNAVVDINPKNILEVGIGNGNVSLLLKNLGYDVTTCDFDKELNPDFVGDIRDLPFKDNSFDAVMACEVIEHLPFEDVPRALEELRRVTKKYVIISIPYSCVSLGWLFKLKVPFFGKVYNFSLSFPYDWMNPKRFKFNGAHYWEMGRKGFPKRRIRRLFRRYFKIIRDYSELAQPEHHFFILERK